MIKPNYQNVKLHVNHNNQEEGFGGQFLTSDEGEEGFALTKLVVKK